MTQVKEAATASPARSTSGFDADAFFKWLTIAAALVVPIIMTGIFWELLSLSWLALKKFGWHFFVSQTWNPVTQVFGAASSIYGTVVSTLIAMCWRSRKHCHRLFWWSWLPPE
jgi:phosphate transport system permease protein